MARASEGARCQRFIVNTLGAPQPQRAARCSGDLRGSVRHILATLDWPRRSGLRVELARRPATDVALRVDRANDTHTTSLKRADGPCTPEQTAARPRDIGRPQREILAAFGDPRGRVRDPGSRGRAAGVAVDIQACRASRPATARAARHPRQPPSPMSARACGRLLRGSLPGRPGFAGSGAAPDDHSIDGIAWIWLTRLIFVITRFAFQPKPSKPRTSSSQARRGHRRDPTHSALPFRNGLHGRVSVGM